MFSDQGSLTLNGLRDPLSSLPDMNFAFCLVSLNLSIRGGFTNTTKGLNSAVRKCFIIWAEETHWFTTKQFTKSNINHIKIPVVLLNWKWKHDRTNIQSRLIWFYYSNLSVIDNYNEKDQRLADNFNLTIIFLLLRNKDKVTIITLRQNVWVTLWNQGKRESKREREGSSCPNINTHTCTHKHNRILPINYFQCDHIKIFKLYTPTVPE